MTTKTICNIPLDSFTRQPTPKELGAIVAGWHDYQQADFIMELAESLVFDCGGRVHMQWQAITDVLRQRETELIDNKGSDLIRELASRLGS